MTYYDEISDGYEELHRDEQLKKIALIKLYISPRNNDKLLDIGCGTGLTTEPWDCLRFGIDPAKKLIAKAKNKNFDITYEIAVAEDIPFHNNFFDFVISVTAIQNFDDVVVACEEIMRVAKPNAIIVISCLKKSRKLAVISGLVHDFFSVYKEIEEDVDVVWFANNKI